MNATFSNAAHFQALEDQVTLGWSAMSAFGQAFIHPNKADVVAEFVAETRRSAVVQTSLLSSFWNSVSAPRSESRLVTA